MTDDDRHPSSPSSPLHAVPELELEPDRPTVLQRAAAAAGELLADAAAGTLVAALLVAALALMVICLAGLVWLAALLVGEAIAAVRAVWP